jgi:hypothetical protein
MSKVAPMTTGRVDEPGRDQVHAGGRELEREILRQRGKRGPERGDERESRRRAAATGAAHEEQGASRANLARGVSGDLQRQLKALEFFTAGSGLGRPP